MIDIHSHILPEIDDGSKSMEMSVEMARMAVEDGTKVLACTPHFMPPKYPTSISSLNSKIKLLQAELERQKIALHLIPGGDLHIDSNMLENLSSKSLPTLGNSNYFLFEPDHHILSPGIEKFCVKLMQAGFHPILTHPERLTWIEQHYDVMCNLYDLGVVVQLTAGSITGRFGAKPKYWSDRMLDEGRVDVIASDAHNVKHRPPGLTVARNIVAERYGEEVAKKMVLDNPIRILKNEPLETRSKPKAKSRPPKKNMFQKIFSKS